MFNIDNDIDMKIIMQRTTVYPILKGGYDPIALWTTVLDNKDYKLK